MCIVHKNIRKGLLLGAMLIGLMRLGQVGNRPTIVLGTVLAASVTVAAEHYLAYFTTGGRPPPDVKVQQFTPQDFSKLVDDWDPSFAEFMRRKAARGLELVPGWQVRGWALWLAWTVDGLLVLLAALGLVVLAMRQPYCNRCRSWLRPIRSGRIDAHTARRLAELAGLPEAKQPVSARYRLLCCNSGCGPTGLELSCEESEGGISSARAWLGADRRLSIMQMLDESQAPSPNP